MKVIVQRVLESAISVDGENIAGIAHGIMVLVGITQTDNEDISKWIINKVLNLRIFPDEQGKMNKSVQDVNGSIMLIPNFTLYGKLKKGFRPSYSDAAAPNISLPMFENMIKHIRDNFDINLQHGIFGADMKVSLINDGPVTIVIKKEAE